MDSNWKSPGRITAVPTEEALEEFRLYLYEQERSAATIERYVRDARRFLAFCRQNMQEQAGDDGETLQVRKRSEKSLVLLYKDKLEHKYAPGSVNTMLASVNAFLRYMGREDLLVRRLRDQHAHVRFDRRELTVEEVRRMAACGMQSRNITGLSMMALAFTGARVSELHFFTVESVNKGIVEIRNKGKTRRILLPRQLQMLLLDYIHNRDLKEGEIFLTKGRRPINRSNFYRSLKVLARKSGVPEEKAYPHNFRHFFARMYYNRTRDLTGLADLLGHSSVNVTRIYTADPQEIYLDTLEDLFREVMPEEEPG